MRPIAYTISELATGILIGSLVSIAMVGAAVWHVSRPADAYDVNVKRTAWQDRMDARESVTGIPRQLITSPNPHERDESAANADIVRYKKHDCIRDLEDEMSVWVVIANDDVANAIDDLCGHDPMMISRIVALAEDDLLTDHISDRDEVVASRILGWREIVDWGE